MAQENKDKPLSKKETLQECIRIWDWLYIHPGKVKSDVPGNNNVYEHDCPCCEYVYNIEDNDEGLNISMCALHCPMFMFWNQYSNIDDIENETAACEHRLSPYYIWWKFSRLPITKESKREMKRCAKQIRDGAIKLLKEYYKNAQKD